MRHIATCVILLSVRAVGYGQQTATQIAEDPRRFTYLSEPLPLSDGELFFEPVDGGTDVFSRLSEFNFSAVRYLRRGYDGYFERQYAEGIELVNAIAGRPLYSIQTALRSMPGAVTSIPGAGSAPGMPGSIGGIESYSPHPSAAPPGGRATLAASDRTVRSTMRLSYVGRVEKWGYSAAVSRRWGRDGHIDGMFADEAAGGVSIERGSAGRRLSLTLLAAPSERSSRGYTTREAFELTGDNLYNPSWGWFDGRQRSSRVRRSFTPVALLAGEWELGEKATLHAAAGFTGGEEAYSGLRWWRDVTPYPDYYRNMPSWEGNPSLEELWRAGDARVAQLNWEAMSAKNLMAGGPAAIMVVQDVERHNSLQISAWIHSRPVRRLEASYGARARADRNRYHARAADMLGARWVADVDQYLVDDEHFGAMAENDLRHSGKIVRQGDEMGYNYLIHRREVALHGFLRYAYGRWRAQMAAEAGEVALWREGLYEKGIFPGAASHGPSRRLSFAEYTVKTGGGYSFSPRHIADVSVVFASRAPAARDVFLSPEYANALARQARATSIAAGELSYRLALPAFGARLTGYYTATSGATETVSYYDDLSGAFSNLVMSGIAKRYYGLEAGLQGDLSPRVSLLAALAAGRARYSADPRMDLLRDADKEVEYAGASSPMKDYRVGGSPQTALTAELRYRGVRGWTASASVAHMRDNYLSPDPTRRMARATALASSPEARREMTSQERLAHATTVGAFAMRTVRVGEGSLSATLSISNLLDRRDIVWAGYEQMRLRLSGEGVDVRAKPHASRYAYSYGRTWYASITYRF